MSTSFFSRRSALKLLASVPAAATALDFSSREFVKPDKGILNYGLLFDEADVEQLRARFNLEMFSSVRDRLQSLDYDAEYAFYKNEIRYNDQLFTINRLGKSIEEQSFLYLMTGEDAVRDFVVASIEQLMKFERWDFFLDGDRSIGVQRAPQATVSICLACDWLGNAIDAERRQKWIRIMGKRGATACYNSTYLIANPREVEEWRFDPESTFFEHRPGNRTDQNRRAEITRNTNLRAVPGSALVIGALTYQQEFEPSAETREWIRMGMETVEAFRDFFKPDGSYNEEVNYATYTATHILQSAIVADRRGMSSLMDVVSWDSYINFLINMTLPTQRNPNQIVNFGDSGLRPGYDIFMSAVPMWIAGTRENGLAQWYGLDRGSLHNLWSVMWYNPSVRPIPPADENVLWISEEDRVVARNGWGVDDTVIALRSGPPANHEHADRNAIMVKAHGQKLITDPVRPPYVYSDPAWPMRLTRGHSAILIDGEGHEHHNGIEGTNASRSYARIKESFDGNEYSWWRSVATQPYRLVNVDIKNVIRSVAFLYDANVIVIADFVDKYTTPSRVTARYFGDNQDGEYRSSIGEDNFTISRPGAVLRATVASNTKFNIEQGVPFAPGDQGSHNPFIDVETDACNDILLVTVLSIAPSVENLTQMTITRLPDGLQIEAGGHMVSATRQSIAVS